MLSMSFRGSWTIASSRGNGVAGIRESSLTINFVDEAPNIVGAHLQNAAELCVRQLVASQVTT